MFLIKKKKNCAEKILVRKFVPDVDQHPSFGVLFYLKSVCVRVCMWNKCFYVLEKMLKSEINLNLMFNSVVFQSNCTAGKAT